MEVGQANDFADSFEVCGSIELSHRFAFDPILWRCDQADRRLVHSIHGEFLQAQ
jgi:hypothetical protein